MDFLIPYIGTIIVLTTFAVVVFFAAFFQRIACGICGEGLTTFAKSILIAAVTLLLTYLAWDLSGFSLVRFSKEAFRAEYRELVHSLTYPTWFRMPLNLKVDAVAWVPMVNKVPYIFALCTAGICTVIGLTVTFRMGLIILILQATMTMTTFAVLNFLLGFGSHFLIQRYPKEAAMVQQKIISFTRPVAGQHGHTAPTGEKLEDIKHAKFRNELENHTSPSGSNPTNKPNIAPDLGSPSNETETSKSVNSPSGAGSIFAAFYDHYLQVSGLSAPYLEKINKNLAPISSLLPSNLSHFLESGGWWMFIGLANFLIIWWLGKVINRFRKVLKKPKKSVRNKPKSIEPIKLAELTPSINSPGKTYLTIKNIPCRIRVFVMSPAGSDSGELHFSMAEAVADHIKPGLGTIVDHDYPLIEIWNRQYSSSGFPFTFFSKVISPDAKGTYSNWAQVAGTVSLGKFNVHVGMALEFMEKNNVGKLEIQSDKWLDLLDVRKSG